MTRAAYLLAKWIAGVLPANLKRRLHNWLTQQINSEATQSLVVRLLVRLTQRYRANRERQISYSQEGEDLLLSRFLENVPSGFFVDVGAHDPVRFSNTYLFYKRGWRGINIDAAPGLRRRFQYLRPYDTTIEALISSKSDPLTFYLFNEPALNTASPDIADQHVSDGSKYRVIEKKVITPWPLQHIFDNYLPENQTIDFLSVDVEGLELEVLSSNDWSRYSPKLVMAEMLNTDLEAVMHHEVTKFLRLQGYKPVAKLFNSVLFELREVPACRTQAPAADIGIGKWR
jgi:hypothetical protein